MSKTKIEWTRGDDGSAGRVWNPTRGCSMAAGSECGGCLNCYAARQALRMSYHGGIYEGLVKLTENGPRWTGKVVQGDIDAPLHVRKPCRWFVDSMSDLFHESVPDEWIDRAFAVMALCPRHTFQVLTKRAERMRAWATGHDLIGRHHRILGDAWGILGHMPKYDHGDLLRRAWPLKNVWLGVSVEDEPTARLRILSLLATPASVRWVSYEPALGPVDWRPWLHDQTPIHRIKDLPWPGNVRILDWLVIGGESGPSARPFDLAWARNAIAQCRAAGVPPFMKQVGARPFVTRVLSQDIGRFPWAASDGDGYRLRLKDRKGGKMAEWPEDLRVREYPG